MITTRQPAVFYATTGIVVHRSCRVDDGPWLSCVSSTNVWPLTAPLPDGVHTLTVQATDDAGATASATTPPFTVDATAPIVTFTGGPTELQHFPQPSVTIEFTVTGDPVATECRFGAGRSRTARTSRARRRRP